MSDLSPALLRFGNVAVRLSVELGRVDMPLRDVLALGQGSVVPLNRLTDELLDITANGKVVAQGEVIATDGRFAMRIVSLVGEEAPETSWPPPPMRRDPAPPVNSAANSAANSAVEAHAHPAPPPAPPPAPAPAPVPEPAQPAPVEDGPSDVAAGAAPSEEAGAGEAVADRSPPADVIDELADVLAEVVPQALAQDPASDGDGAGAAP